MELLGARAIRRMHLEHQGSLVAGEAGRQSLPGKGAAAGWQVEVQSQRVDAALSAHGLPAGAEVVVRVEQGHGVQHRLDQGLEGGSAKLGDDVGVADVEADPDSLRADPVDQTTEDHRARRQRLRPGKDRRQVLHRDRDSKPLRAQRQSSQRAGLEQQRILALRGVRQSAGVVDDVSGADLGRVGEQALRRAVCTASSHPEVGRGMDDRHEPGGCKGRGERGRVRHALARVGEDQGRRRVDLNAREARRLERLQERGGGPPVVWDVQAKPVRRPFRAHPSQVSTPGGRPP